MTIDLMQALKESLAGQAVTGRVTFPRASSTTDNEYWAAYFMNCLPLMREWVSQQLSDYDDVFGLSAATESDALTIVTEDAERELQRELNANERKLLKSVTRDLVIVTTAKRAATELRAIAAIMAPDDESAITAASFADHVARVVEYRAAQAFESADRAMQREVL
jgi:hypothetical protein